MRVTARIGAWRRRNDGGGGPALAWRAALAASRVTQPARAIEGVPRHRLALALFPRGAWPERLHRAAATEEPSAARIGGVSDAPQRVSAAS